MRTPAAASRSCSALISRTWSQIITGPAVATYDVKALPAGTYFFHCDVHPTQMFGTLVVGG